MICVLEDFRRGGVHRGPEPPAAMRMPGIRGWETLRNKGLIVPGPWVSDRGEPSARLFKELCFDERVEFEAYRHLSPRV